MIRLALILSCLALLSGCAGKLPVESASEFYGECITAERGNCDSDYSICQSYADIFKQKYVTLGQCLSECKKTYSSYSYQFPLEGCDPVNSRGSDSCEENCRRLYPAK